VTGKIILEMENIVDGKAEFYALCKQYSKNRPTIRTTQRRLA
jgi:hypothetical protein